MSGRDDVELSRLMRAAVAGDERAYAAFLLAAAALVRGFCRSRTGASGIDPEDIVQETLLAIHLKRHTWRQDGPVMPWVFAIARYKLIDAFRRRGGRIEVDVDELAESLAAPEVQPSHDRAVTAALDALPAGQRTVVASISVEGLSIGETARRLGMTEGAVRVALHRGLTAIAGRFGRH